MLDLFSVFTKSGLVLWCFQDSTVKLEGDPLAALVKSVLLEARGGAGQEPFLYNSHALKYSLDNVHDLVFAAVYQKNLDQKLTYIGALIDSLKERFLELHGDEVLKNPFQEFAFDNEFTAVRRDVEDTVRREVLAGGGRKKAPKDWRETEKSKVSLQHNLDLQSGKKPEPKNDDDESDDESDIDDDDDEVAEDAPGDSQGTDVASNIAKLRGKKGPAKGGRRPGGFTPGRKSPSKPKKAAGKKDSDKWDGPLDMSEAVTSEQMTAHNKKQSTTVLPRGGGKNLGTYGSGASTSSKAGGGVFSYFNSLTGTAEITEETIAPVLEKMRFHLSGKNVAAEIAEKICGAVGESLLGTTKGTFQSISTVVEETVHASLTNILTPKRRIDILRDAMACKGKRPYTVVFCGVNGVGKSTNLAKICYWLLQNDLSVCIAACDTFRAGAIDQLATHCQKLNAAQEESGNEAEVLLYQSGYGKDAANVAHDAIQHAGREGYDVVLVDTAGRMQNNGPLMAALAKLVGINHPDLVLFVGEALVGNEAVDQLSNFNKALADNSYTQTPRLIDGIVLSKFDTVDDKVGSAISMTYTTGQPIVFVGTGQSYGDLKTLDVDSVVATLLK